MPFNCSNLLVLEEPLELYSDESKYVPASHFPARTMICVAATAENRYAYVKRCAVHITQINERGNLVGACDLDNSRTLEFLVNKIFVHKH